MKDSLRRLAKGALTARYRQDYPRLIRLGAVERPNYGYIVYQAAELARRLGLNDISVLEFGVAGGRGLLNLETHAERVGKLTGVGIHVYGFDTGEGLPPPVDYRDLPYIWQESHFRMDQGELRRRLKSAKLILGLVRETIGRFAESENPAPIGAISFDLDYYSSTVDALRIFDLPPEQRLPRIFCYFDDCYSSDLGHVGAATGVPLAIAEFNATSADRHLGPLTHLEFSYGPSRRWHRQIYSFADFKHTLHDRYLFENDRQLTL